MRRAAKTDDNQFAIVTSLRRMGYSVLILSGVGKGCPDICVGLNLTNWLFEIKDDSKPKSRQALTVDEKVFHSMWRGQVNVVGSLDEILAIVRR